MKSLFIRALALAAMLLCRPETVQACATCFGRSDSRMAEGMNMGIFTLLGFIACTLAGLSCFFVFLAVRASRYPSADGPQPSPDSPDKPAHS
jgi:hypothetical protein